MEGNLYVCIMFEQKVSAFIQEKRLFGKSDKVLVALSGGADSVALLRVLLRLGYHCEAAHCNFHLRGEESVRDEKFVVSLAEDLGVKLHKTDFDTAGYASDKGISVEMAARDLRYAWFARVSEAVDAKVVAVAHHRNDSVETFLMNLVRGTGIDGLLGIRAVNGKVVRPLLCVDREDILDYLKKISLMGDQANSYRRMLCDTTERASAVELKSLSFAVNGEPLVHKNFISPPLDEDVIAQKKNTVRIAYDVNKSKANDAKHHAEASSYKELGSITFDYYLRMEDI